MEDGCGKMELLKKGRSFKMSAIVKLDSVSKSFKKDSVLTDVSVEFEQGKIYGIVGKNGAGKTVLFKVIAGFLRPTSGHVYVKDKEIGVNSDFAEDIGLIIETPGFLSQYSAYKNLEYLASIRNKITEKEIREAIRLVGLDDKSKKKVGKFSLGMRQRLGIAQAIMENPDYLILDEPFNGLDQDGVEDVHQLLQKLKKEGKCILLASHSATDISKACDEVYKIKEGKIYRS